MASLTRQSPRGVQILKNTTATMTSLDIDSFWRKAAVAPKAVPKRGESVKFPTASVMCWGIANRLAEKRNRFSSRPPSLCSDNVKSFEHGHVFGTNKDEQGLAHVLRVFNNNGSKECGSFAFVYTWTVYKHAVLHMLCVLDQIWRPYVACALHQHGFAQFVCILNN